MNSDFIMRELIVKSLEESVKLTESFLNDKTQINNIERAINLIVNALRSGKKFFLVVMVVVYVMLPILLKNYQDVLERTEKHWRQLPCRTLHF